MPTLSQRPQHPSSLRLGARLKYPAKRTRSSWIRRESKAARTLRTRAWRGTIDASVAVARARQLPLVVLAPLASSFRPDPPPHRIPADRAGRAISEGAVDAYCEARRAEADA